MESVADRAKRIYAERIAPRLGPGDDGKAVAIEVESGDYEIAPYDDHIDAVLRLRARHEDPKVFTLRIGYRAFAKIGGSQERLRLDKNP